MEKCRKSAEHRHQLPLLPVHNEDGFFPPPSCWAVTQEGGGKGRRSNREESPLKPWAKTNTHPCAKPSICQGDGELFSDTVWCCSPKQSTCIKPLTLAHLSKHPRVIHIAVHKADWCRGPTGNVSSEFCEWQLSFGYIKLLKAEGRVATIEYPAGTALSFCRCGNGA